MPSVRCTSQWHQPGRRGSLSGHRKRGIGTSSRSPTSCRAQWLRQCVRRLSSDRLFTRRRRCSPCHAAGASRCRSPTFRHRLHQLSRHRHAQQRRQRTHRPPSCLRSPAPAIQQHQGLHGAHHLSQRQHRGRLLPPRPRAPLPPRQPQLPRPHHSRLIYRPRHPRPPKYGRSSPSPFKGERGGHLQRLRLRRQRHLPHPRPLPSGPIHRSSRAIVPKYP